MYRWIPGSYPGHSCYLLQLCRLLPEEKAESTVKVLTRLVFVFVCYVSKFQGIPIVFFKLQKTFIVSFRPHTWHYKSDEPASADGLAKIESHHNTLSKWCHGIKIRNQCNQIIFHTFPKKTQLNTIVNDNRRRSCCVKDRKNDDDDNDDDGDV